MTRKDFNGWLSRAQQRYIDAHNVESAPCKDCGKTVAPTDRVMRKTVVADGVRTKRLGVSDFCPACRTARGKAFGMVDGSRYKPWGSFDYTAWAESVLYPEVQYDALTLPQRQHAYWLARARWASDGLYAVMMPVTNRPHAVVREIAREERARLRALRDTLARRGCAVHFPPYTDWLDADDYADDHGRDAGATQSGRDDADLDGDTEGEEAA